MLRHLASNILGLIVVLGFPVAALLLFGAFAEGFTSRTGGAYLTVIGWILVVYLVFFIPLSIPHWLGKRAMRAAVRDWAQQNGISFDALGPWVLSNSARTGFVFLGTHEVVLITLVGQRYVQRFQVDELIWETKANPRGMFEGLTAADIWPPANAAPKGGSVKVRHISGLSGETKGQLKHAGIY